MDVLEMEALLKNVDQRFERDEHILPTLATKDDLTRFATKVDLEERHEDTRRYFDIVAERLRDDIRLIAEGQVHLAQRVEESRIDLKTDIAAMDSRLMRLEAAVPQPQKSRGRKRKGKA